MNKLERIACLYLTFLGSPGGLSFAKIREYMPGAYVADPAAPETGSGAKSRDFESVRRKFERDKEELRSLGMDLRFYAAGEALPDGSLAPQALYVVADELQRSPEINLSRKEMETLAAILLAALAARSDESAGPVAASTAVSGDAPPGAAETDAREYALLETAAYKLLYKHPALLQNLSETVAEQTGTAALAPPDLTIIRDSASDVTEHLTAIHEALSRRLSLRILYADKTGAVEERQVDGRGLISHRGRWCLVAHCHLAKDVRMFYVDRITRLETTDRTYRADRNFDIKRYSLHPLALFIEAVPLPIEVEVDPDREESLLDFLSGAPQSLNVQHDPDSAQGPLRVGFQTTNPTAFFSWMIRHPGAVLRIGPAGTHARFLEHLSALKSNYADLSAGRAT